LHATETHHTEEVLDVVLPADDQPAKVMQPSKEPLYTPTPSVAPQRATVLCGFPALSAMGCDHLDAIALGQIAVQARLIGDKAYDSDSRISSGLRQNSAERTILSQSKLGMSGSPVRLTILKRIA
jgi:hypothetical protein